MAHSIKLGTKLADLVWTSFFDDFICVCRPKDAKSTDAMIRHLFDALGWELATDAQKDKPFSPLFSAFGVEFDLTEFAKGAFTIGNTAARKEELSGRLTSILEDDRLTPQDSTSMRSRILFAESQVYGRMAKLSLTALGGPALSNRVAAPLFGDELRFHMQ